MSDAPAAPRPPATAGGAKAAAPKAAVTKPAPKPPAPMAPPEGKKEDISAKMKEVSEKLRDPARTIMAQSAEKKKKSIKGLVISVAFLGAVLVAIGVVLLIHGFYRPVVPTMGWTSTKNPKMTSNQ